MLNRALAFYTNFFAVWVILFGAVAYFVPEPFRWMRQGMSGFFALTMFGIGAVLNLEDFKRIGQNPLIIAIGSIAQFTLMPLGAYGMTRLFHLPPELAVGLILTGAAPGAMSSNVMSYIAGADTAYSVSLTTVSTLLCPVLTPALVFLLARTELHVPFLKMFVDLVLTVVMPLGIGLAARHFFSRATARLQRVFPAVSVTFIIFICSVVIAVNRDYLILLTGSVLAGVAILNLYGMAAGYGVGTLFRMSRPRRRTLCIEIGMQNAGLGTVLALKHFSERTAIPAALFVFVCIVTGSVLVERWRRSGETAPATQGAEVE